MNKPETTLTERDRERLYAACLEEAQRVGGDERCAEYFFVRAQSSQVWFANDGAVTIADMRIEDWCDAIAWSAPGMGKPPRRAVAKLSATHQGSILPTSLGATAPQRKQPRFGAKSKRTS